MNNDFNLLFVYYKQKIPAKFYVLLHVFAHNSNDNKSFNKR